MERKRSWKLGDQNSSFSPSSLSLILAHSGLAEKQRAQKKVLCTYRFLCFSLAKILVSDLENLI